eukprot:TRINITY_DN4007_c0_g2_i1.p1 TRINITY_DN4007_c0_g2~~TRINITY_DN4007_c0_g2_i1.p1  ORF type:complete len:301 (+),score=109.30 TRINITY_DN4007_c0_g2_i1:36-905(+)
MSSTSSDQAPAPEAAAAAPAGDEKPRDTSSDYYWNSYAHFGIHEEMLKDTVRTKSYRSSILNNKHLIEGKVVLDVGCGTGIISLFCATAGAKHVYAVDASSILDKATQIVADNGFSDVVTTIKGKIEEIELPVDKVDVIVSEWMGYFLFYESMLDSVLFARDKWLKEGGVMLPDKASMWITAIEDEEYKEEKINWWDNVWGYNMSCIRKVAMEEPLVDSVNENAIVTDANQMMWVDINTVKVSDLDFSAPFKITAIRSDHIHALVVYFDITFDACHKPVFFSTGAPSRY